MIILKDCFFCRFCKEAGLFIFVSLSAPNQSSNVSTVWRCAKCNNQIKVIIPTDAVRSHERLKEYLK